MFYVFFGLIRAAVPNPSSAGFGRPFQIRVRPDSGGRSRSEFGRIRAAVPNPSSAGFGRTGGFGRIRADGAKLIVRSEIEQHLTDIFDRILYP